MYFLNPHPRICLLILDRGERRKRERERNVNWLSLVHALTGTKHATQACGLTRNQTCNLSVCRRMPNQLSYTSQSPCPFLIRLFIYLLLNCLSSLCILDVNPL